MPIINEEKLTFYDAYESFCYQNCQRQILEYYKIENSLFYINSSRSLIIEEQDNYKFKIKYNLSARSLLPSYDSNVKRIIKEERDYLDVWKDNLSLINNDIPIIVGVDSYFLSYLPFYKKSHGKHTLILSGYNEKEETVDIVDWFFPWFFKGKVDIRQFLEARDSKNDFDGGIYSGKPIYNNWAIVNNVGFHANYNDLIKETIEVSIKQFYESDNEKNTYHGIKALSYLLELLIKIQDDNISDDEKKRFLKTLYNSMYFHNRRNFFLKFYLEQANKRYERDNAIYNAINDINAIYEQWEKWLYLATKCQYKLNINNITKLLVNMQNIYELEKNYEKCLRNIIKCL